jgi:hypothetical protein
MYGVTSLDANARTINVVETAWTTFALRLEEIRKVSVKKIILQWWSCEFSNERLPDERQLSMVIETECYLI